MTILIIVIGLALLFDVINGFHDAANSIATVVGTRVLSPRLAVLWAAFFNFISYLIFKLHVANTIAKGIVHPEIVTMQVLISGLLAAIIWNLATWFFVLPSSSSHTLIGGFVGAAIAGADFSAVIYSGSKITHLKPFEGFSAETSGAITLFSTSILGIPVSTTHTITGAIVGVGAIRRFSAVR